MIERKHKQFLGEFALGHFYANIEKHPNMLGELEESSHKSRVEESKEVNSPFSSKKSDKHIERIRELARRKKREYIIKVRNR